jgi:hypothetical protein
MLSDVGLMGTTPGTTANRLGRAPGLGLHWSQGLPRPAQKLQEDWPLGVEHSTHRLFGSGVGMTVLTAWRWRRYE